MKTQPSVRRMTEGERRAVAGLGTFACRNLKIGERIFTESPFLIVAQEKWRTSEVAEAPVEILAALSAINIHHDPLPPCIRLAATDSGGILRGSEDSYLFAKAYARCSLQIRMEVMTLSEAAGADTHAIVRVVRAEVAILRNLDAEIRAVSSVELEGAILR